MLQLQQNKLLFASKGHRRTTIRVVADASSARKEQVISSLKNYMDDRRKTILSRKENQVEVMKNWIQEELDAGKKLIEELAKIVKPDEQENNQVDRSMSEDSNDGSSIEADDEDGTFRYQLVPVPVPVSSSTSLYY